MPLNLGGACTLGLRARIRGCKHPWRSQNGREVRPTGYDDLFVVLGVVAGGGDVNKSIDRITVCDTPHAAGIPTTSQATISSSGEVRRGWGVRS